MNQTFYISDDYVNDLIRRGWADFDLHRICCNETYQLCQWYRLGWNSAVTALNVKELEKRNG